MVCSSTAKCSSAAPLTPRVSAARCGTRQILKDMKLRMTHIRSSVPSTPSTASISRLSGRHCSTCRFCYTAWCRCRAVSSCCNMIAATDINSQWKGPMRQTFDTALCQHLFELQSPAVTLVVQPALDQQVIQRVASSRTRVKNFC